MAQDDALNGKLVVLVGGSGFIGNYVAQALLQRGARLRIASRHPEKAFTLKPLANLGQLQFARCDVTNARSVQNVIAGADAVVNMAGGFDDMKRVMGDGAGIVAEAATATGAAAFVHVSALVPNLGEDVASSYADAKRLGEERVRAAFPQATILRPSVVFASDDKFVNRFAGLIAAMPVLPVFGPEAKLQPVFADDVAEAIATTLGDPAQFGGKAYELAGPEVLTMLELNRHIAAAQERTRSFVALPDAVSGLIAALPLTPITSDQWQLLKAGNVASGGVGGFKALGIQPRPLGLFLDRWMVRYRKQGRFTDRVKA